MAETELPIALESRLAVAVDTASSRSRSRSRSWHGQ